MSEMIFAIFCLMISLVMTIVYFSKKRVDNTEMHIYGISVCICLAENILLIMSFILCNIKSIPLSVGCFTYKLHGAVVVACASVMFVLFFSMIFTQMSEKTIVKHYFLLTVATTVLIVGHPLEIDVYGLGRIHPHGPALRVVGIYSVIYVVVWVFFALKYFLKDERVKKVTTPLMFLICFSETCLQLLFPSFVVIIVSLHTFVVLVAYFKLENPDVYLVEEINSEKNKVIKANNVKDDFIKKMSVEVEEPLNTIRELSDSILKNREDISGKTLMKMEQVNVASRDLWGIAQNITAYSKLEGSDEGFSDDVYSLKDIIETTVSDNKYLIVNKNVVYNQSIDDNVPSKLIGDTDCIGQILGNLISNAFKYTYMGFVVLSVTGHVADDTCHLTIKVKDTGRGITEEELSHVYTRFERGNEVRNSNISGMGLGLAITYELIKRLGGTIEVSSKIGEGTEFTVNIDQKTA